jgi:uncharacterized protein YmfQ (DUF2313 family)
MSNDLIPLADAELAPYAADWEPAPQELEGDPVPSDYTFCPDHDDCFLALMNLLPRGTAWDNTETSYERGSVIRQFMSGLALSWLRYEDAMCISLDEWICSTSDEDLDLWAADFGIPDECDIYNMSLCAKVQHSVGAIPTAKYLLDLLAANGYTATGRWLTGHDTQYPNVYSTFHVVINTGMSPAFKQGSVLNFKLGHNVKLGLATLEEIDCMLERYVPAHCKVDMAVTT